MVLFVFLLVLVIAATLLAGWARRHRATIDGAWAQAAQQLGGRYDGRAGPWYNPRRLIEAEVGGPRVLIDHYTVSTGQSAVTYTRGQATVDFAGGLWLKIYPKGFWSNLGTALGAQDVETGDPVFDESYMVKSNDEERARAWLSPELRRAIAGLGDYTVTLKEGNLKVEKAILESEASAITQLAAVTAQVARRGAELRRFWTRQAAERGGAVESTGPDRLRIAIDGPSVPLRIDTRESSGATAIVARRLQAGGERFEIQSDPGSSRYDVESDRPDVTKRRLSPEVEARLRRLGALRIEADEEELRLVASGVEGDAERLQEAMALAEELAAADPRGIYR